MLLVFQPLQKLETRIHQLEQQIATRQDTDSEDYQRLLNLYDQLMHDFKEKTAMVIKQKFALSYMVLDFLKKITTKKLLVYLVVKKHD